jgi:cell division protein FtsW (lipid II flippase)
VLLVTLAVLIGCVVVLALSGSSALVLVLLCLSAVAAVVSAVLRFVIFQPSKERITVYPRYVPEDRGK